MELMVFPDINKAQLIVHMISGLGGKRNLGASICVYVYNCSEESFITIFFFFFVAFGALAVLFTF